MRDPKRIRRITNLLASYWETYPDLRLCQIVANTAAGASGSIFYVEDDVMEKRLREALKSDKVSG